MSECKITLNIENLKEIEFTLNKRLVNPVEAELWSESKSGRYILAVLGASYVVFEKSEEDNASGILTCKYAGLTHMGPEDDECGVCNVIWRENGGCAKILLNKNKKLLNIFPRKQEADNTN